MTASDIFAIFDPLPVPVAVVVVSLIAAFSDLKF
jgi:hypothetical protein